MEGPHPTKIQGSLDPHSESLETQENQDGLSGMGPPVFWVLPSLFALFFFCVRENSAIRAVRKPITETTMEV